MKNKKYAIEIYFDSISITVSAKNAREAKKKALARLEKRNAIKLIGRTWPDKKREIYIDEID
jgi:hypothetical protein